MLTNKMLHLEYKKIIGELQVKGKIILLIVLAIYFTGCSNQEKTLKKGNYTVSILPEKFFLKKIVKDRADIEVMVKPGHSPATYEPLPSQLENLKNTKAFFTIGVPFEKLWLGKISKNFPSLTIIDFSSGMEKRKMDHFKDLLANKNHDEEHEDHEADKEDHEDHEEHEHHHGSKDPHIWLSPKLVKIGTHKMLDQVIKDDPKNEDFYTKNYYSLVQELDSLTIQIKKNFANIAAKEFLVFHPSFGYFADEFNLKQIPIEVEGKKPSPKLFRAIIDYAKEKNIKAVFIQPQFNKKLAESIAEELNIKVIVIDPLSEDYIANLKNISEIIANNAKM